MEFEFKNLFFWDANWIFKDKKSNGLVAGRSREGATVSPILGLVLCVNI